MVSQLNVICKVQGIVSYNQYVDGFATQCNCRNARNRKLKTIYGLFRNAIQLPKCKEP